MRLIIALLVDVALVDDIELAEEKAPDAEGGVALCFEHPATIKHNANARVPRRNIFTNFRMFSMTPFYAANRSATIRGATTLLALLCGSLGSCATTPAAQLPTMQQQYQFVRSAGQGPFTMKKVKVPVPQPGAHQVLIRVHATSLNRRDIFVLQGQYPVGPRQVIVPLSDGAGEVVALGSGSHAAFMSAIGWREFSSRTGSAAGRRRMSRRARWVASSTACCRSTWCWMNRVS